MRNESLQAPSCRHWRPELSRKAVVAASLVSLTALSACQLAPSHTRPDLPTSATYPSTVEPEPQSGVRAPTLGWRDFFADPRLDALIAVALERNRDLVSAVAQIEEARGAYRIQRADLLPTLSASAEAARARTSPSGSRASRAGDGSLAPGTSDFFTVGVGLSVFELDFWGRVRNLTAAALAQYLGTVEAARAFRLSLIREVAFAYLQSLEAGERVELAEATVQSRRDELRLAEHRLDSGVISELELRQAETLLTQAEAELAALRFTRAQSDNLLERLIGGPLDTPLPEGLPLARQVDAARVAAGLPSDLLGARPDILAAEERLRAARANIGAARAAYFPTITLTGSYGYASTELSNLVGQEGNTWNYGPVIDVPLFDFGRRRGAVIAAQARETIALAEYERSIQTAFQEVSDALAGRRYLAEQVAAQERGTRAQRRLAELARKRYLEGVVSYLEVLDAERNLFASEQTLLQLRRAEAANLVSLYVALGGGVIE
jgi:multidrug efflux system outer membrane protein